MIRYILRGFQRPAVIQEQRDTRSPEGMIAELLGQSAATQHFLNGPRTRHSRSTARRQLISELATIYDGCLSTSDSPIWQQLG